MLEQLASLSQLLASPGLSLLFKAPCATPTPSGWYYSEHGTHTVSKSLRGGMVRLLATEGRCECAYNVRHVDNGRLEAPAPRSHGPSSAGPRSFKLAEERMLLRVVAPESATPGLNWALGLDALRVLEAQRGAHTLDWLLSIDAEDEEDMRERIACGVQGESFRRDRQESPLSITSVPCGPGNALVLPEECRVAVTTAGALPEDTEVLWRVSPNQASWLTPLERCVGGAVSRPYWVSARSMADARMLARSLPPGATWVAELRGASVAPSSDEVQLLQDSGCGGLALPWTEGIDRQ